MQFNLVAIAGVMAAATLAAGASATTYPNLIVDGGFEDSGFGGTSTYYNIGRDHATPVGFGWKASNVDIVANGAYAPYLADGGDYVVDLSGYGTKGYIAQKVTTEIGLSYTLSFDYAKQARIVDPTLLVQLDGTTFATLVGQAEWNLFSQTFVATKTSYMIYLKSSGTHNSGVYIDNVLLIDPPTTIPEPTTWGLMLSGLALVGLATRFRAGYRSRSVTA